MAEGVKQLKDITITYEATELMFLSVYTDMPGGAMGVRKTIELPATGGSRKTTTFPLDTTGAVEGKLVQFRVSHTTTAGVGRLYEGKIKYRPIGLYLDGATLEFWETQPLSLGS